MKLRGFTLTCWLTVLCFLFTLGSGATPLPLTAIAAPSSEEESPDSKGENEEVKTAPQRAARRVPRKAHDPHMAVGVLCTTVPLTCTTPRPLYHSCLPVLTLPLRC